MNRFTSDLDIVFALTPRSVELGITALRDIGFAPNIPVNPLDLGDPEKRRIWVEEKNAKVLSLRHRDHVAAAVDIFLESPLPFETLYNDSKVVPLGGNSVRVCSVEHLIELKRIAGRPIDLVDIESLETILEHRRRG